MLIVRTDLKMGHGKIAAQCGHATLAAYKTARKTHPKALRFWQYHGQAKIAVKIQSEAEMFVPTFLPICRAFYFYFFQFILFNGVSLF